MSPSLPPRIAWYALGGGLGHLNRALAILRHFRPLVPDAGVLLFTSSAYAHLAIAAGVPVVRVPGAAEAGAFPKGAIGALVAGSLTHLAPLDLLVVDAFADGLHLELSPEVLALARRRALIYREGAVAPATSPGWASYDEVFVPMPATESPSLPGTTPVGLVLHRRPDEGMAIADARRWLGLPAEARRPLVLGMHAGDPGEVAALFGATRAAVAPLDVDLRLITPLPMDGPADPTVVHHHPAAELLPAADIVVAAGGYNTVAELRAYGRRAVLCPLGRSHDRQINRIPPGVRVFDAMTPPAVLTAMLKQALGGPAPAQVPASDTDGAAIAARHLAALLTR